MYDGLKKIISIDPYDHLDSEKNRRYKNRQFIFYNKECLCDHDLLHPTKTRKGKYIQIKFYNKIKQLWIRDWNRKRILGLSLSEDIPDSTNDYIS